MKLAKLFAALQLWSGHEQRGGRVRWDPRDLSEEFVAHEEKSRYPVKVPYGAQLHDRAAAGHQLRKQLGQEKHATLPCICYCCAHRDAVLRKGALP